jgi:hypothetical protein
MRSLLTLLLFTSAAFGQHLGFDRNAYPGDANLSTLRKTFEFTGYWLNNPPGASSNSWKGKRKLAEDAGFGFLLLYNGKVYDKLKGTEAEGIGSADGLAAVAAAREEGFPARSIIFLDQEEGGVLLEEQGAYLFAWIDAVNSNGYRAGVYCSGIPVQDENGKPITTAEDIKQNAGDRKIAYFVFNDSCPPSAGCTLKAAPPGTSQVSFADIWQFAQSPRRSDQTASCSNTYASDGNCYPTDVRVHVDLDTASHSDPSHARADAENPATRKTSRP